MRVLVVGHAPIYETNRDVYRALAQKGVDVTCLVPECWQSTFGPVRVEPSKDACRVVARSIRGRHHSNLYWFAGGVEAVAAQTRADVIYVDEDPAGFAAAQSARAARRLRAGLVILAVQNIFKRYPPPFDYIAGRVLRQAGAAVTNSQQASLTLQRRGYHGSIFEKPLTTDVKPLAVATRTAVRARHRMGSLTFGYVGRLVPEKGIDVFLRALASFGAAQAIVVGDGPERAALETLARQLGIADRVRFTPAVSPREATDVIGALDVLVLPSLATRSWTEQFGRVLIEAMASGVPVAASRSGAIPETLGDAGILFSEGDSRELAAALRRLSEPSTARTFARRGLERVAARFTPEVVADSFQAALQHALSAAVR